MYSFSSFGKIEKQENKCESCARLPLFVTILRKSPRIFINPVMLGQKRKANYTLRSLLCSRYPSVLFLFMFLPVCVCVGRRLSSLFAFLFIKQRTFSTNHI